MLQNMFSEHNRHKLEVTTEIKQEKFWNISKQYNLESHIGQIRYRKNWKDILK